MSAKQRRGSGNPSAMIRWGCGDGGVQMSEQGNTALAAGAEVAKKHSVVK